MPDPTRGADRTKVLSVRFTAEEFDALSERAAEVGVGPSTLARTFVRQALAELPASTPAPAPAASRDSALEARLEELLAADLVARVEALERRTAED
jgi:transposase-like protein